MRLKFLQWLAKFTYKNYQTVLFSAAFLFLVSIFISSSIKIQSNWVDLLPGSLPSVKEFNSVLENFSSDTDIIVVLSGNKDSIIGAAESVSVELQKHPNLIRSVDFHLDRSFLEKHGLLLQDQNQMQVWMQLFDSFHITQLLSNANRLLEDAISGSEGETQVGATDNKLAKQSLLWLQQWLGLLNAALDGKAVNGPIVEGWLEKSFYGESYYFNPAKNRLLMLVRPQSPDNQYAGEIIAVLNKALAPHKQVKMGLTGVYMVSYEELETIKNDVNFCNWIDLGLTILIFLIVFRLFSAPFVALAPILLGIVMTLAIVRMTIGHLNLITSIFGVVLLGLGIDYSIHILSHYTDVAHKDLPPSKRIHHTLTNCGQGLITSAVTTSLAFFTLMIAGFRGLSELGFTVGVGVLTCLLSALFILPSLLIWTSRHRLINIKALDDFALREKGQIDFEFLRKLGLLLKNHRWTAMAGIAVTTVILMFFANKVAFDRNRLAIQPNDLPSIILLDEIVKDYNLSPDGALLSLSNLQEVRHYTQQFKALPEVGLVDSITQYLPEQKDQDARLALISTYRQKIQHPSAYASFDATRRGALAAELRRLQHNLIELSSLAYLQGNYEISDAAEALAQGGVSSAITKIEKARSPRVLDQFQDAFDQGSRSLLLRLTQAERITTETLPYSIQKRYIGKDGKFLLSVFPAENVWDEPFQSKFLRAIKSVNERSTGAVVLFSQAIDLASKEVRTCTIVSFISIFALLWLDYGLLLPTVITIIPLVLGTLWMLGVMGILGIQYNILNVMAIPLIIGIGIDNGVHLLRSYFMHGKFSIPAVLRETGKAILLTSITTIFSFGALAFAHHPGVSSFGLVLTIGICTTMISTLIILPTTVTILEQFGIFVHEKPKDRG